MKPGKKTIENWNYNWKFSFKQPRRNRNGNDKLDFKIKWQNKLHKMKKQSKLN